MKFLVIGYGSIGRRHVNNLKTIYPESQIIVVSRHSGLLKSENAGGKDSAIFVESLDQALKLRPEFAIIASPSPMHVEAAIRLAGEGVHLLVEKPLSNSLLRVDELLNICRSEDVCLHVGYNLRFLPTLQFFRAHLHNGSIGRILSVRCEVGQFLPAWRPQTEYQDTVTAQKKLGGGVLLELSHEIDYLRWIFGEIVEVTAIVQKLSGLEIDVEDTAMLLLKSLSANVGEEILISLNMDCTRHDVTRRCIAIGDKGSLLWDGLAGTVAVCSSDKNQWEQLLLDKPDRDLTYTLEIQHFMKCIVHHQQPGVHASGHDAEKVLQVIEAARKSATQKRTITLTSGKQNE